MIGYHLHMESRNLGRLLDSYFSEYEVGQIFISNPKRFQVNELLEYNIPTGRSLVVHAPFVVSLLKDDKDHYTKSLSCLCRLSAQCMNIGAKYLVTHLGGIKDKQTKPAMEVLYEFVMDWLDCTNNHETILCLECDAGSKTGKKKGSLTFLYNFVSRLNHPRIKICYDNEHAFANGFDMNKTQLDFLLESNTVAVVHLNSIPNEVEIGRHLDRHTDTNIIDGQYSERVAYLYWKANSLGIPCILERNPDLVPRDLQYLEETRESCLKFIK